MKKITYLIAFLIVFLMSHFLRAQPVVIKTFAGTVNGAVCPGIGIEYEVSVPSGFGACTINWSATNGTATKNRTNQRKATVVWNDLIGATGTVTATFTVCGEGNEDNNGTSKNLSELILSIKNQAWNTFTNSYTVNFCNPVPIPITMPEMVVMGTGGFNQPDRIEVAYVWKLPTGWQEFVTGNTGEFGTTTRSITIVPTACAEPGTITVKGTLIGSGPFCNSAAFSSVANISINSSPPIVTVVPQAGYTGSTACNTTPVTFTAVVTNDPGCTATSYTWTHNSSWTVESQSGNTITLSPSGAASDATAIKGEVTFGCGSKRSGTVTPTFTAPVISGPDLICGSGTYSISNTTASATWSSSNTSILTINQFGQATRLPRKRGAVSISAVLSCPVPVQPKQIWVGEPNLTNQAVWTLPTSNFNVNPITLNPMAHYYFYMTDSQSGGVPGATDYTWYLPAGFNLFSSNGYVSAIIQTAYDQGSYELYCVPSNACGTNGARALTVIIGQGGGGIILVTTPNPTTDEVSVWIEESIAGKEFISAPYDQGSNHTEAKQNKECNYILYDEIGREILRQVSTTSETKIDVRSVKEGIYILKAAVGERVYFQRLLIRK